MQVEPGRGQRHLSKVQSRYGKHITGMIYDPGDGRRTQGLPSAPRDRGTERFVLPRYPGYICIRISGERSGHSEDNER